MAKRPAHTILLVTRHSLVRADFHGGKSPKLSQLWEEDAPETDDMVLLVESALALGPQPAKRIWILNGDLWTQTITVPGSIAELSGEELARALAFEAEPFSGLGAFESVLGYQLVEKNRDQATYWITQARSEELGQIEQVLGSTGSNLAGVCHPGGVPQALTEHEQSPWQRTELWDDAVVCLHGKPGARTSLLIINSDPDQNRWQQEQEAWQLENGAATQTETLLKSGEIIAENNEGVLLCSMERAESLRLRLQAWAEQLTAKSYAVPLIRPLPKPMSQTAQGLVMTALLSLSILCCAAHHLYLTNSVIPPLKAEIQGLKTNAARFKSMQSQLTALQKERKELVEENKKTEQLINACSAGMDSHRKRVALMLYALAKHQPKDLMIESITNKGNASVISGLSVEAQPVQQYATSLDRELRPLNWSVATKQVKNSSENGLFTFEIHLDDLELEISKETVAKTKN